MLDIYSLYSLKSGGPLKDDGWFKSFKEESSIDANGNPLPWMTYPAIDFLNKKITGQMSIFEYGCGYSTLWWATRTKEVIAVEHNRAWYEKMKMLTPENATINYIPLEYGGQYSRKVSEFCNKFDIIVIDGRDRVNCAINSLAAIKDNGVIIWDNSERKEYEEGIKFLHDHGYRRIEFIGMCPIVNYKSETSLFYKSNNVLGI